VVVSLTVENFEEESNMDYNILKPFFFKNVVLVVQGHIMTGIITAVANNKQYVNLSSMEDDPYEPAVISISSIGAIRAYSVTATTAVSKK
jgi:hypothetical protein